MLSISYMQTNILPDAAGHRIPTATDMTLDLTQSGPDLLLNNQLIRLYLEGRLLPSPDIGVATHFPSLHLPVFY